MTKKNRMLSVAFASFVLLGPFVIGAQAITFQLAYSGSDFGNSAEAFGQITFDDGVFVNDNVNLANVSPTAVGITAFSISVSGASAGNGTFSLADFAANPDGWIWSLLGPLDLSANLVGQANFIDFNWCAISFSCDNPDAPGGSAQLTITLLGETGEQLNLISMQVVPIPAAVWLFGSAIGLLGWLRRKV